jgi:hypothetical protein
MGVDKQLNNIEDMDTVSNIFIKNSWILSRIEASFIRLLLNVCLARRSNIYLCENITP